MASILLEKNQLVSSFWRRTILAYFAAEDVEREKYHIIIRALKREKSNIAMISDCQLMV
ncbi:MAG: hypothetical protein ACJ70T_01820 [Nitrososphaera sp.]